jgi:hypothetical protein
VANLKQEMQEMKWKTWCIRFYRQVEIVPNVLSPKKHFRQTIKLAFPRKIRQGVPYWKESSPRRTRFLGLRLATKMTSKVMMNRDHGTHWKQSLTGSRKKGVTIYVIGKELRLETAIQTRFGMTSGGNCARPTWGIPKNGEIGICCDCRQH